MSRVREALLRAGGRFEAETADPAVGRDGSANNLLAQVPVVPYRLSPDAALTPVDSHETPIEEFRALRTRLNHMQSRQPIRTLLVTSPSPAEGKSFAVLNLALAQAQLSGHRVLLCDFDFRRPVIHKIFQMDRGPGLTDYLLGKIPPASAMRRIGDANLYIMPAGEAVMNPLELLNLPQVKQLLARVSSAFNWVLLDSPPLLYAADANLLATMCDATLLVVRIGATTIDSIARAQQTLCHDNVIGIVVNGAHRGELYGKYPHYASYNVQGSEDS